ncbi:UNVERIFIED_CONTAM: hypothetical protein Sradi_5748400 [Sesamum radiatum]|uniref:Uncharacterized protein n=1 Tax=Sesamum radiatum TaxID=300843 RepID=A0AAW2L5V2_SESRA
MAQQACSLEPGLCAIEGVADQLPLGTSGATVVKTILKYLKRTKDMFLIYSSGELILEGYSDGSFPSDDNDVKSQLSFVFKHNGHVVAWKSSKQATRADSTTEAEYIELQKQLRKQFG